MRICLLSLVPVLSILAAGCGDTSTPESAALETVGVAEEELTYRYCSNQPDCASGCSCVSHQCVPDGFGPPNPDCGLPPVRACTKAADCRSGCVCSGGSCQQDGFGPPNPYCYLPPPDAYENDSTPATASYYMGSPQAGHTFHEVGDEDWVLVYFGNAVNVTFETYDLVQMADTYLEVYKYNYGLGTLGPLVGSNENVCSNAFNAQCAASRVTINVPANSVYAIRVQNRNVTSYYNQATPGYSLRLY